MTLSLIVLLVLLLGVVVVGLVVIGFDRLRRADLVAEEALGAIDVQLARRADLAGDLVATVEGRPGLERAALAELTRARAGVAAAAVGNDVAAKAAADLWLRSTLLGLDAALEADPHLKAHAGFLDLQRQLAESEGQLAFARQHHDDAVRVLNDLARSIPWRFLSEVVGIGARARYDAPEGQEAPPRVGA